MTKHIFHVGAALLLLASCSKHKEDGAKTGTGGTKAKDPGTGTAADPGSGKEPAKTGGGGGLVSVDGSSTVYLIAQAVAEDFQKAGKGDVTVASSGTGGGFKKFCRGEVDVADASRPIKQEEVDACKAAGIDFIELPVAYDGIAVVVNPKADFVDHLTVAELKKMWEPEAADKIKSWSQIRDGWPDKKLSLFGPGTDSGTYDYFTEAVNGKQHSSRGDYTSSEDDNVLVTGVAGDEGGLGFFGYAYYTENQDKLKLVPIDDEKDEDGKGAIAPDPTTVADGTYQPLSRPLFIYVSVKSLGKQTVHDFVAYFLDSAKALSAEVGYIALPDTAYDLVTKRFEAGTVGSVFAGAGSQVGVTVEKLLASEGK
jgi:phosphate transport system substrate-binding protein